MTVLVDLPERGGFFKPDDYAEATCLVEPSRFVRQQPSGRYGPKDTIYADVTVFGSDEALDAGTPDAELVNVQIQQTLLAKDLEPIVGSGTVVILTKGKAQSGQNPPWVWRKAPLTAKVRVQRYLDAREVERKAALDAVPSFDEDAA